MGVRNLLLFLLLLLCPPANAETFNDYVTGLPLASPLTGTELGYIIQGGISKKFTPNEMLSFIGGSGVFNVRAKYGAVPDGITDNSAAITSAFAATNSFVSGIPTVYFDCDTSTTTCVYNYGGSGTSPINPTRATSIVCAPGATLNYTGTAHAIDMGPVGGSGDFQLERYLIQGCRFTGGASYTAGIYFYDKIINSAVLENVFYNFGNSTGFTIVYSANNWLPIVVSNLWSDDDGKTRNMIDAHTLQNGYLLFTNNIAGCLNGLTVVAGCDPAQESVGIWTRSSVIANNDIEDHNPAVILGSCQTCGGGVGVTIKGNHFEDNTGVLHPAIAIGDPGGPGEVSPVTYVTENTIYWPSPASGVPIVGPSTASSGMHSLQNSYFTRNWFQSHPGAGAVYINTNQGTLNTFSENIDDSRQILTQSSTPTLTDTGFAETKTFLPLFIQGSATAGYVNKLASWDSTGTLITPGSFHSIALALGCANSVASGTAQTCSVSGPAPAANDMIIFSTNTTNTGALTINVNSSSAAPVKKTNGTANLGAGDIVAGIPYVLTFDGTNWQLRP